MPDRVVDVAFRYAFDDDDIRRILRACGHDSDDVLLDGEISEYVSEILTFELTSPDPLADEDVED